MSPLFLFTIQQCINLLVYVIITLVIVVVNVKILWTSNGLHPIFVYIPIKMQMLLTLQKPCVMSLLYFFPLFLQLPFLWRCHLQYFLLLLPHLSFLWTCHLWYLCSLSSCLYHCWHCMYHDWHYKWFHFAPHHFLCLYFYSLLFLFTHERKVPPSSTLFFLLRTLFGKSIATFFLFVCISSLIFFTLANGFYGFSFGFSFR